MTRYLPLVFGAPMVRALLDGRKTQTRRVVSPHNARFGSAPSDFWDHADFSNAFPDNGYLHVYAHDEPNCRRCEEMGWEGTAHRLWPIWGSAARWNQTPDPASGYIPPSSQVWVRETFCYADELLDGYKREDSIVVAFKADKTFRYYNGHQHNDESPEGGWNWEHPSVHWRSPIHMPRWASRLTLKITDVRVQRLQEISEEDAKAEGCKAIFSGLECRRPDLLAEGYRDSFESLWEFINGTRSWDANPWVWALTFEVHQ